MNTLTKFAILALVAVGLSACQTTGSSTKFASSDWRVDSFDRQQDNEDSLDNDNDADAGDSLGDAGNR